ncbi:hypothetical protein GCM10023188_28720 [Pontibacter saemangeumensis]|uniref:Uncharacterized protein n=1 Tax=Pontibacter saemangeumensis TaxID=1084525 RepID=A0ABP8LW66_9BACT
MIAERIINKNVLPDISLKPELVYKLENLDVSYNAADEVLTVQWAGEISSEDIRVGYEIVMRQVKLHRPSKLLFDFHKRVSIKRKAQRWVFSTVFPKILRTVGDNVFVAIVLPVELYHGLVADMDGDELMHANNFLIIHHSLYREEGLRWLATMRASARR